jgi:broad specificity phosphatase PhoE
MGIAVDDTVEFPSGYVPGEVEHHDQWRWPRPYSMYAELLGRGLGLASVAGAHRRIWTTVVIAHGGGIEPGLVACLPNADHDTWGGPFGHCDGARLGLDQGRFTDIQIRRAPAKTPS